MRWVIEPWELLWGRRGLLWRTTMNDIRSRNAGSVLGIVWVPLYPLMLLGCYALVYIYVYSVRYKLLDSPGYVAVIFCGLIPFLAFSEALGNGVPSVTGNTGLIKNTMFPIELVPVKAVLVGQPTQWVGMGMLLVATGLMGRLTIWVLVVPLIWVCQMLFTTGLVWILASLNVYVKDLARFVGVIVLMLMMISPIAYPVDDVPANLRPILAANPLFYMILAYQDAVVLGRSSGWWNWGVLAGMSVSVFYVGYWFFGRLKRAFTDNI